VAHIAISPAADLDLEAIWASIAAENPDAATRVLRTIGTKIGLLATHPRLGRRRIDLLPSMRMLVEGTYLILYETHPDSDDGPVTEVEIVRVIDGRRDVPNLLF
jgi:toxin ParE1/3/4